MKNFLATLALVAFPAAASAMDGEVEFLIPPGATEMEFEISDPDNFWTKTVLEKGTIQLPANPGDGAKQPVNFEDLFCNENGHVAGPEGDSEEKWVNLKIRVKFIFKDDKGNVTGSTTPDLQRYKVSCEDDKKDESSTQPAI